MAVQMPKSMPLENKIALVTGASKGIGRPEDVLTLSRF
jgi:hypothetical protein